MSTGNENTHCLFVLPNTNDEDFSTELHGIDSGVDAALDTSTFKSNGQRRTSSGLDPFGLLLGGRIALDENGADTWNKSLCEVKAALEEIADDDRFRASSPGR